jgi:RNA polymerase sigma-70 factor (ECF subfamily)
MVKQMQQPVYYFIRRMVLNHEDANDLTQNTFIKVWEKRDSFKGTAKLSTWVFSIATNEALGHLRKQKLRAYLSLNSPESFLLSKLKSDSYFDGDEAEIKFQKAVLSLPEKQRMVFNFRYFDELSFKEISEITGLSEGGLKANYHYAKSKVENFLNNN